MTSLSHSAGSCAHAKSQPRRKNYSKPARRCANVANANGVPARHRSNDAAPIHFNAEMITGGARAFLSRRNSWLPARAAARPNAALYELTKRQPSQAPSATIPLGDFPATEPSAKRMPRFIVRRTDKNARTLATPLTAISSTTALRRHQKRESSNDPGATPLLDVFKGSVLNGYIGGHLADDFRYGRYENAVAVVWIKR